MPPAALTGAAVLDARGVEVSELPEGAFFGEIALLVPGVRRTASVVALSFCEAYRISRIQFEDCVSHFPALRGRIQASALERMRALAEKDAARAPPAPPPDSAPPAAAHQLAHRGAPTRSPTARSDSPSGGRVSLRGAACATFFVATVAKQASQSRTRSLLLDCRQRLNSRAVRKSSSELPRAPQGQSAISHSIARAADASGRRPSDTALRAQQSVEAITARLSQRPTPADTPTADADSAAPRRRRRSHEWGGGRERRPSRERAADAQEAQEPSGRHVSREARSSREGDEAADDGPTDRAAALPRGLWRSHPLKMWTPGGGRSRVAPEAGGQEARSPPLTSVPQVPPQLEAVEALAPPSSSSSTPASPPV